MPANKGRQQLTNFAENVAANPLALAIETGLNPSIFGLLDDRHSGSEFGHGEVGSDCIYIVKDGEMKVVTSERYANPAAKETASKAMERVIERQQRTGQREVQECDMLPTEHLHKYYGEKGEYAALGIKVGKQVEGDPLFTHVTLPTGWKKRSSDHPLHMHVVDEKGHVRLTFFYDAKFYDRRASMHAPRTRYNTTPGEKTCYTAGSEYFEIYVYDGTRAFWFRDGGICEEAVIYSYGEAPKDGESWTITEDRVAAHVKAWLESNYPEHNDPLSYWP